MNWLGLKFRYAWRWLLLMLLLSGASAWAQTASDEIQIRSPYLSRIDQVYALNAQLIFDVPMQVEQTVQEGATLNLVLQIRVSRDRRWWRDVVQAELEQRYQVQYHAVSERFLVRNLNSGAQASFISFADAMASLKHIDNLPMLDRTLASNEAGSEISMRASMDVRSIPRALGLLLFWVDSFSLESDWYAWPLKP